MRTVKLSRQWLRRISRLLLLCLAFQTVAVAAHACPMLAAPVVALAASSASHGMDGADCAPMAMPDSALCAQHCAPDRTTSATGADLQVPLAFLPALPPSLPVRAQPLAIAVACATPLAAALRPIRTRYCSLLI